MAAQQIAAAIETGRVRYDRIVIRCATTVTPKKYPTRDQLARCSRSETAGLGAKDSRASPSATWVVRS